MKDKELVINKYDLSPNFCKTCKTPLSYRKRNYIFCSRSCSAKTNNIGIIRNRRRPTKNCISCGKIISKKRNNKCSKCLIEFKIINGFGVNRTTRQRYLIKIRGYQCEECKNIEWNNKPIPLDMHHIDGNRENNILTNLKLLCKNCHAQTPTYCSKKGKIYTLEDCIRDIGEIPLCGCDCKQKVIVDPSKYKRYKNNGYPKFLSGHSNCKKFINIKDKKKNKRQ